MKLTKLALICALGASGCATEEDLTLAETSHAIVGGTQVSPAEYESLRFMVGLGHKPSGGTRTGHQCGGTLIHPRWVLTAAHCFEPGAKMNECIGQPSQCRATIGASQLSAAGPAHLFGIERVVMHPSYQSGLFLNDIALVKLSADVPNATPVTLFTDSLANKKCYGFSFPLAQVPCDLHGLLAAPKPYPPYINASAGDAWKDEWYTGTRVLAAGWGATEAVGTSDYLLQTGSGAQGALHYEGRGSGCYGAFEPAPAGRVISKQGEDGYAYINDQMICAIQVSDDSTAPTVDACNGDSGGPLLVRGGDGWQQVGITSFGACQGASVYTYLPAYEEWIASHLGLGRIDEPGLVTDTTVSRRVFASGSSGYVPPPPGIAEEILSVGKTAGSSGATRWTTENETLIAFDAATAAGSQAELDRLIIRHAKIKLFVPALNGLSGERGAFGRAGSMCLYPNTRAWDRKNPVAWSAKPTTGSCLRPAKLATTKWNFMSDYAGYARIEGDDLNDYVTFEIPIRSQAEAKQWLLNGFTLRSSEGVGFGRGFASANSVYTPQLTVVYDCPAGYRPSGNFRCKRL